MQIKEMLTQSVKRRASDLHLSAGLPAMLRIDGSLSAYSDQVLTHEEIAQAVEAIMSPLQRDHFRQTMECDFSFDVSGVSRFRVNVFQQIRGISVAFRAIPSKVPSLADLQAPDVFVDFALRPRGLVLVTGPTGSGKSTTLAAMIHELNTTQTKHVLTIEDPVEFLYVPDRCLINQREVGGQTLSFANALRAAMREDPNVILVGEMRDLETIRLAITAAETGHLVLATLHTSGAAKAIDRIIDVFPAEEKSVVRSMLSESLTAVISQVLCKRKEGEGRVAAYEIMVGNMAVRNLIRESKVAQLYSAMQTGSNVGMQTLDQALTKLVQQGRISKEEAASKARYPENFGAPKEA
jgi:twitching motility protein PilT